MLKLETSSKNPQPKNKIKTLELRTYDWSSSSSYLEIFQKLDWAANASDGIEPKKRRPLRDQECDELNVSGMIQKLLFFFYVFATGLVMKIINNNNKYYYYYFPYQLTSCLLFALSFSKVLFFLWAK